MIKKLFKELKKNNLTISSAESITGGRFSSLLVEEEGASNFLKGSFVCYDKEFKYKILNVSKNIEIVSPKMAEELSIKSRKLSESDISISFTGNSSDNGIEGKQKGLVYIGISNNKTTEVTKYISSKNERKEIIDDVASNGVKILFEFIKKNY